MERRRVGPRDLDAAAEFERAGQCLCGTPRFRAHRPPPRLSAHSRAVERWAVVTLERIDVAPLEQRCYFECVRTRKLFDPSRAIDEPFVVRPQDQREEIVDCASAQFFLTNDCRFHGAQWSKER